MSLPYDYILSLSDVTKFGSLRNVYVLNPSPSTLVTKAVTPVLNSVVGPPVTLTE